MKPKSPREPTMTVGELARMKGVSQACIFNRAKRIPLPPRIFFESKGIFQAKNPAHRNLNRYSRSLLLAWWEETEASFSRDLQP